MSNSKPKRIESRQTNFNKMLRETWKLNTFNKFVCNPFKELIKNNNELLIDWSKPQYETWCNFIIIQSGCTTAKNNRLMQGKKQKSF